MYFILPATGNLFQKCLSDEAKNAEPVDPKKWSKLEMGGLLLDIGIVAALILTATSAIFNYYDIPLGSINGISVANTPYIGVAVLAVLLIDCVKICCQRLGKKEEVDPSKDQRTGTDAPDGKKEKKQTPPDPKGSKLKNDHRDDILAEDSSATPDGSQGTQLKTDGADDTPGDTRLHTDPPIADVDSTQKREKTAIKYALIDLSERTFKAEEDDGFVPFGDTPNQTPQLVDDGAGGEYVVINPSDEGFEEWRNDGLVANTTNAVKNLATGAAKSVTKPGTVQKQFYFLHVNFIVEQLLYYREDQRTFKRKPLPLSFLDKVAALDERTFTDSLLQGFKQECVKLIRMYRGQPDTTRREILKYIETFAKKFESFETTPLFLFDLCERLFTKFDGLSYGKAILDTHVPLFGKKLNFKEFADVIESDRDRIKKLEEEHPEILGDPGRHMIERGEGSTGVGFKPLIKNNFANKLWKENGTVVVRFPSPTIQEETNPTVLLEQMKVWVHGAAVLKNKTLFCFEHQCYDSMEKSKIEPVAELAKTYPEHFYFFNLSMDDRFYHQEGTERGIGYGLFKANLIKHMQNQHMSENTRKKLETVEDYNEKLAALADEVHIRYFPHGRTELSVEERKDFIFIYYLYFRQYIHTIFTPNISFHKCKDTMDRSMTMVAGSHLKNAIDLGEHNNPEVLEQNRILTHFVGMVAKGSAMDGGRFDRYLSALRRMTEWPVKKHETTLKSQTFSRPSYQQTATCFPCDAQDFKEYLDSKLMNPTDFYPVLPLQGDEDMARIVSELYKNNTLNCNAKIEGNQFTVYSYPNLNQSGAQRVQATGEFRFEDNYLRIKINDQ